MRIITSFIALAFVGLTTACGPDPCLSDPRGFDQCVADREARFAAMRSNDDNDDSSAPAVAPLQERADRTFGNDSTTDSGDKVEQVPVRNDRTEVVEATGSGGQQAGDKVPTRTVKDDDLGGTSAQGGSGSGNAGNNSGGGSNSGSSDNGDADSGVTENDNEAPGFD